MENNLERGYVLPDPAAVVFIVGDRRIALSVESAQYALYNMILYAQVKGIGTYLWGGGKVMLDNNRTVRKFLGLKKYEHILGAVLMGYPDVKFRNKVEGKTLPVKWVLHRSLTSGVATFEQLGFGSLQQIYYSVSQY